MKYSLTSGDIPQPRTKNPQPPNPAPATPSKPFRFMDLPPELRNRVYGYALIADREVQLCLWFTKEGEEKGTVGVRERIGLNAALLRASQAINAEAAPILYSANTFSAVFYVLERFVEQIEDKNFKALRKLVFTDMGRSRTGIHKFLVKLKQLKQFEQLLMYVHYAGAYRRRSVFPTPESLVKVIGPWIRELHRAQKKDTERKSRDVRDVVKFHLDFGVIVNKSDQERLQAEQDEFDAKTKELLGATLK